MVRNQVLRADTTKRRDRVTVHWSDPEYSHLMRANRDGLRQAGFYEGFWRTRSDQQSHCNWRYPRDKIFTPGSPSLLPPRNPPNLAMARTSSRSVKGCPAGSAFGWWRDAPTQRFRWERTPPLTIAIPGQGALDVCCRSHPNVVTSNPWSWYWLAGK